MKQLFANINYWKLAISKCINKCVVSGIGTFLTSMKGLDWYALSGFDRFCVIAGILLTVGGIVDAFLDNTMSQLRDTKTGDTTFIKRPDAQ